MTTPITPPPITTIPDLIASLTARRAELSAAREQAIANANACNGALIEVEALLATLQAATPPANGHDPAGDPTFVSQIKEDK